MKPFYSIQDIADILNEDVYATCNALIASNADCYFNGKKIALADYECFRPSYSGETIFVHTGGPPEPGPSTIIVSADILPVSWKERLADKEPLALVSCWPWGNYETELLRKLAAAAERFWKRYDPADNTTAPTNQQVIEWLKQQGVAERTAEIMATILRVDGLPTGPRK